MDELPARVRAVCDLDVAEVREFAGRHEYDGQVQDLSPAGVRDGLARLDRARQAGPPQPDPHDEAHLAAFEARAQVAYRDLELHRRNPLLHLAELDLAGYDREYAPAGQRAVARLRQLAAWPQAVDAALASLDQVSRPVAGALLSGIRGLAAGIPADAPPPVAAAARAAHERLVQHVARLATEGDPDPALGAAGLAALMGSAEGLPVDLGRLAERADAERNRLLARLAEDCARIDASRPALELCRELVRDHPGPDGVIDSARQWTELAIEFTRDRNLVPYHDGVCLVGPAPESRRWAMAMISTAAPGEPDAPSWFYVTPPEPSWPAAEVAQWLEVFSATTLPGIAVHEVAPGHFSHGRALRRVSGPVRPVLHAAAFLEGWAHYAEELCVEEGFRGDDPRFAIGVWLEALVRVTRLACAIGVHTAGMTVEEGARRFAADTHLAGPAALSEARRATFDPTYGRYTWGKLLILDLREQARKQWGDGFSLLRFHTALLSLGSPPLGLLGTALDRG
jgi:Bacterial protein of unknown function (DUF885)